MKIISWILKNEKLLKDLSKCFESVFFYVISCWPRIRYAAPTSLKLAAVPASVSTVPGAQGY